MISTTGAGPLVLGFLAFALSLISTIVLLNQKRTQIRNQMPVHSISTEYQGADINEETTKPGLWKRIPTFGSHKYVQVGKQPVTVETTYVGVGVEQQAVVVTSPSGYGAGTDGDWAHPAGGYGYAFADGRGPGIPMMAGPGDQLQAGSVYEPFMIPGDRG